MKRRKAIVTFGLAAILACGSTVPAAATESETSENLADLFYTYSNDNMVMNYTVPEYLTTDGQLQLEYFNGFLFLQQLDMNWDGIQELLAVRIKTEEGADGTQGNDIVAEIYQREDNTLQRKSQYVLASQVLQASTARIDIFTHDTTYGTIICCEASDTAAIGADGTTWSMRAASFDGTNLNEVSNATLVGSSFGDTDLATAMAAMTAAELNPVNVVYTPVTDDTSDTLTSDYTITRYLTADNQTILDYLNGVTNDGSMLQYGETTFQSITNTTRENKIPGDFYTIVGASTDSQLTQEAAGAVDDAQESTGAYTYQGDYVIPDSSTRYITTEELQNLSEDEILLARNEIYAKHGYIFNNQALSQYFSSKSWYIPNVTGTEFTEDYASRVFNDFEIQNILTIVQYENANGLNQFE